MCTAHSRLNSWEHQLCGQKGTDQVASGSTGSELCTAASTPAFDIQAERTSSHPSGPNPSESVSEATSSFKPHARVSFLSSECSQKGQTLSNSLRLCKQNNLETVGFGKAE